MLFLVSWKEQGGTTVVHVEDYKNDTIITNVTSPTDDARGKRVCSSYVFVRLQVVRGLAGCGDSMRCKHDHAVATELQLKYIAGQAHS
jgi:hypothetical protein